MRVHKGCFTFAAVAGAVFTLLAASAHAAPSAPDDDDDDDEAAQPATEVVVTARKLDEARASVEPSLGASTYALSNGAVENRPGGESSNLVHVMLQMPGVAQGGAGELSVRAQTGLQYRINNAIVPDGFTDLADTLRARFADNIQLVTGALPAQYGLQVGGVVNVTSKNGVYARGAEVEAYGGSQGHAETAFEAAGSVGATNLYVSGSYLHDRAGLGSLDGDAHPPHDTTDQFDAFTFIDHIVDAQSRVSLIAGLSSDWNELPNARGLDAATAPAGPGFRRPLSVAGVTSYPSEALDGTQRNQTAYGILTYQRSSERLTYQVSASLRGSTLRVSPDPLGDLLFHGVSEAVVNNATSAGLQAEGVYDLSATHKLRAGFVVTAKRDASEAAYLALPVGPDLRQVGDVPSVLTAREAAHRTETSFFAQDEWRPLTTLTVNFGLRFDKVAGEGGGSQVSPRLNAVWEPVAGTTLHAGYARYFVPAPELDEAGWPRVLAGTSGAAPGPHSNPVRAETDDYFDIGVQQSFEDLKLGLDAYWREAANLLDEVRVGSTVLRRPFNFADGRVRGVEFSATYGAGPVTAWGNLAVARAEGRRIVSGQASFTPAELALVADRFVPTNSDQTVTASFGSTYHWRAFRLSADATYGSGLPRTVAGETPNEARLSSYVQTNMSAVYRLDGLRDRPLDLRVDASNVFDARYALRDGTSLGGGYPEWGRRRGVVVGFEQQF
jgi:outer membrane cobalamin receptor